MDFCISVAITPKHVRTIDVVSDKDIRITISSTSSDEHSNSLHETATSSDDYQYSDDVELQDDSSWSESDSQTNWSKKDILSAYNRLRREDNAIVRKSSHEFLLPHLQQLRGQLSLTEITHLLRGIGNLGAGSASKAILSELFFHIAQYDHKYVWEPNKKATNEIRLAEMILNLSSLVEAEFVPATNLIRATAARLVCAIDSASLISGTGVVTNIMNLVHRVQRKKAGIVEIDLHGMSHPLAKLVMESFVKELVQNKINTDTVKIIYGKGKHRFDGKNVMKEIGDAAFSTHQLHMKSVWEKEEDPEGGWLILHRLASSIQIRNREAELRAELFKRVLLSKSLVTSLSSTTIKPIDETLEVQGSPLPAGLPTACAQRSKRPAQTNIDDREYKKQRGDSDLAKEAV